VNGPINAAYGVLSEDPNGAFVGHDLGSSINQFEQITVMVT
jgi:hypothetical protein